MLDVDDEAFWSGVTPLAFGPLPRLQVRASGCVVPVHCPCLHVFALPHASMFMHCPKLQCLCIAQASMPCPSFTVSQSRPDGIKPASEPDSINCNLWSAARTRQPLIHPSMADLALMHPPFTGLCRCRWLPYWR